jgi:hypothetical protein
MELPGTPVPAGPVTRQIGCWRRSTPGKVEALIKFVKANLPPGGFKSLVDANRWAEQRCTKVNGETQAVPVERLRHERALLRGLPERATQATREVRKVDRLGTVRFGSARYSVPSDLLGFEVELLVDGDDVRIVHRGAEVALHRLQPPRWRIYPGRALSHPTVDRGSSTTAASTGGSRLSEAWCCSGAVPPRGRGCWHAPLA